MNAIRTLEQRHLQLKADLSHHKLFRHISCMRHLQLFMESHVFAVWDFMSLAKRVQRDLSSCSLPWTPPSDPLAARLINEIILGEESDVDPDGGYLSHFELYLKAMEEIGAQTTPIRHFVQSIPHCQNQDFGFLLSSYPAHIRTFVGTTLNTAIHGRLPEVLGFFFYGREDLIPDMFRALLKAWDVAPTAAPKLHYYLERHITLDGDHHGPASARLLQHLIVRDSEDYRCLMESACLALELRIAFWNGVQNAF